MALSSCWWGFRKKYANLASSSSLQFLPLLQPSFTGLYNVLGICRADELARAGALLPEPSSIELSLLLASVKLTIVRKFFRDAYLSWVNMESCPIARFTWPLMDRRCTNQLIRLRSDIISTTAALLTGYCLMGRHSERKWFPFSYFCSGRRSAEEEETVIHLFC